MRLSPFANVSLGLVVVAACSAGGGPGTSGIDHGTQGGTAGSGGIGARGGTGANGGGINPNGGSISVSGTSGTGPMDDPDVREAKCSASCTDLASSGPLIDMGVPSGVEGMFSGSPSGTGPCLLEPGDNTLVPYNWLRPRVHISGHQAGTVYKITISTPREADTLVAYTNKDTWILPQEYWDNGDAENPKGLTYNVFDEDITVTVRASGGGESSTKFRIAPVKAGGSLVFWSALTTEPGANTNALYGFAPGDEGIVAALRPLDVLETVLNDNGAMGKTAINDTMVGPVPEGRVRCVGCHTSTPDGAAVNITDHWPWNVRLVNLSGAQKGNAPDYVTPMGDFLMQMPWQGVTTYSKADWAAGNHRYVTSFGKRPDTAEEQPWTFWAVGCANGIECAYTGKDDLIWLNLAAEGTPPANNNDNARPKAALAAEGTGWGIIPRTGDTNGAVLPDWSHNGATIVYTSTDSTADGHVGIQPGKNVPAPTAVDLYTVPFNGGMGGPATPVAGASDAAHAEYYPDYSADDLLIAYTRVSNFKQIFQAATSDEGRKVYYRPEGELFVVKASGGEALELEANAPPACTGEASPGVYNSWPKWSPIVREAGGKKYYFLIFSSARESPAKVKDKSGNDTSAPMSQLYMTALVDSGGTLTSYGASYLWNQRYLVTGTAENPTLEDFVQNNVTPAWDEFQAPPVPPVKVVVR